MRLTRTNQCAKCPWKVSTDPNEIPDGYCEVKHANLESTIATEGEINLGAMNVMACHHSNGSDQMYCVGWLSHQLGVGNNIGLRMRMFNCENARDIKLDGEQHQRFEDTLPKPERKVKARITPVINMKT